MIDQRWTTSGFNLNSGFCFGVKYCIFFSNSRLISSLQFFFPLSLCPSLIEGRVNSPLRPSPPPPPPHTHTRTFNGFNRQHFNFNYSVLTLNNSASARTSYWLSIMVPLSGSPTAPRGSVWSDRLAALVDSTAWFELKSLVRAYL